ncbi:unnamed protein product [Polarella glacialis]|uniref:Protein-tyrosine sulfotransferase n=2 Tax=Polarella glacialis TaxID=89957 RepID=A0A813DLV9_POLGL|nr:unnamed protein product [Polarella glacialis]
MAPHGASPRGQSDLLVIGLGWPRTGTGTLCDALDLLGFGPCHHLRTLLLAGPESKRWRPWDLAAAEENRTRRAELVLQALRGFSSAADVPVAGFWEDLLHAQAVGLLPSSTRFILPRRTAAEWYASAEATVLAGWREGPPALESEHAQRMGRLVWSRLFGRERLQLPQEQKVAMDAYAAHQRQVERLALPGTLVHWAPEDGWAGLCGPLGIPEPGPEVAFPWRHQRGSSVAELLAVHGQSDGSQLMQLGRAALVLVNLLVPVLVLVWFCCCRGHVRAPAAVDKDD